MPLIGVGTGDVMKPNTLKKGGPCDLHLILETAELVSCRALGAVAFH